MPCCFSITGCWRGRWVNCRVWSGSTARGGCRQCFSREETRALLAQLEGPAWLAAALLYGAGLRLMECLRLRIQGVNLGRRLVVVRSGKGGEVRHTPLPERVVEPLTGHLTWVRELWEADRRANLAGVELPEAPGTKYPNVGRE